MGNFLLGIIVGVIGIVFYLYSTGSTLVWKIKK